MYIDHDEQGREIHKRVEAPDREKASGYLMYELIRDNMYDWVHQFREVLLEYMNNHNSMFNAIINNIDEFKK